MSYGKKGQIALIEMITSVIILFVSLGIFFPGFSYHDRWSESLVLLKGKDLILTIDRLGKDNLYNLSFNLTALEDFLNQTIPISKTGIISWSETEGTFKPTISVACNCTNVTISALRSWFTRYGEPFIRVNDRKIKIEFWDTTLDSIKPGTDVLLIWGYKNLSKYKQNLLDYLAEGNGIVEMSDIGIGKLDDGHKQIFDLQFQRSTAGGDIRDVAVYDEFRRKPNNASDIIYTPWKYFYHIPIPLLATQTTGPIPSDQIIPRSCGDIATGNFSIQANITGENIGELINYMFWICDSTYVYFDTDRDPDGKPNVELEEGYNFYILDYYNETPDEARNWTFYLSYINGQEEIGVSFRSEYKFHDFIKVEWGCSVTNKSGKANRPAGKFIPPGWCRGKKPWSGYTVVLPGSDDYYKILIQADTKTKHREPIPGVVLNTNISRTAWISNFTEEGVGDDEKLLLLSLLFWASNKEAVGALDIKIGYTTSYINTVNIDMFEIYRFNLGLGYPY